MSVISDMVVPSSPYNKSDPESMPRAVWLTAGGECFQSAKGCFALESGQHTAEAAGFSTHERRLVPLAAVQNASVRPRMHCFPPHVNADAERCMVMVGDSWKDGFIIARCKVDGPPNYLVNYRNEDKREETRATEDQIRFSWSLAS